MSNIIRNTITIINGNMFVSSSSSYLGLVTIETLELEEEEFEEELEDEVALLLHELNVTRSVKTLKYLYIFFIAKIL